MNPVVNNLKVFVLLAGMVALFGVVGGMLGGQTGMLLALVIAAVMSGVMYFNSGKMALRAYRAQVVSREQAPEIYEIVDRRHVRAHGGSARIASGAPGPGNPLAAFRGGIANLFSTHPPTEERIARLEAIAQGGASARL